MKLLIHEAITLKDKEPRDTAITGLGVVGQVVGDTVGKDDFTPGLTALWFATNDPKTMRSTAESIGSIGSASGVEALLAAALAPAGKDDARQENAVYGLMKVNRPTAVPPLAALLEKNPVGSNANTLAFTIMDQIADKTASEAVVKWLQTTDSSAAPLATSWVLHARSSPQVEAAEAALDPAVRFQSEENRKALRAGLEAYRANHKQ